MGGFAGDARRFGRTIGTGANDGWLARRASGDREIGWM
jgi:hypothetical protein